MLCSYQCWKSTNVNNTRNTTKSCRAPADGAHRKGCYRGRMSTAGGVQGEDCVRRRCATEGYVTVKNCVTLHVLSSSLPGKGRGHAVCNLEK
jgi:hypothetical protein